MKPTKQDFKRLASKHCDEGCRSKLEQILETRALVARYRPVADLRACNVYAQMARASAGSDQPTRDVVSLFAVARRVDLTHKLAKRYLDCVLDGFAGSPHGAPGQGGRLILPMPAPAIEALGEDLAEILEKSIRRSGLTAQGLILLHPGLFGVDEDAMLKIIQFTLAVRDLGIGFARTGFGCDLAEEALWAECPAELCVLDEMHLEGLNESSPGLEGLRESLDRQRALGRKVLAQGVNGQNVLDLASALGIELACGDFIGKFSARPHDMLSAASFKSLRERCDGQDARTGRAAKGLLGRLLLALEPVTPETSAEEVFRLFEQRPDVRALAVVDEGRPLGIISRYEMTDNMARPYRHELFGRKPCTRFMDAEPLILDVHVGLVELMDQVVHAHPRHLISGFIVTDAGLYVGMGSVQDLMREITAMQIEAARYANPLTQLPGNVPINQHIDNLLKSGVRCAVAYCDLDSFKPFNDVYGYAKGDEIIQVAARVLADCVDPEIDFIGHVGGDDFVLVFRSPDWEARCRRALDRFAQETLRFFSPDDIERGGYVTTNRKGELEFHALTSLSIGALECEPGQYATHLEVARVAAEVKKKAKAIPGNSMYVNQRRG